ncbi:hypothetical protein D3C83_18040 [compost metagenome]
MYWLCRRTFALQKLQRIAFRRIRHQLHEYVQQFADSGTVAGRHETHWNQVPVAECFFKRSVQLFRLDVTLFEILFH